MRRSSENQRVRILKPYSRTNVVFVHVQQSNKTFFSCIFQHLFFMNVFEANSVSLTAIGNIQNADIYIERL